jgi:hypothetical protein
MANQRIQDLIPLAPTVNLVLPVSDGSTTGKVSLSDVCGVMTSAQITAALGFTPVQQGGGAGQSSNKLYIGWSGSNLLLQVDATNFGNTWPLSVSGNANTATTASNGAKAWVNFDGTTVTVVGAESRCTIRSSYNVSKVVRNTTGDYSIYFTTPMIDVNYSVCGNAYNAVQGSTQKPTTVSIHTIATTTCRLQTAFPYVYNENAQFLINSSTICAQIFGN